MKTEHDTLLPKKGSALAEFMTLPNSCRQSTLFDLIFKNPGKLLESEEISSAIGSSGASGFGIDTVDFAEEDIEVHESEIHVNFHFTFEGQADNAHSSGDVTLDGTATAIIDADGGFSIVDIEVSDGSDSEDCESGEFYE